MSKKVIIGPPELAETVTNILIEKIEILYGGGGSQRHSQPNIIKVPADVRKDHDDAYEPKLFFIGPYHCKPSPMEEFKLLYVHHLLSRDNEHKMSRYVEEIMKDEEKARQQYSELINLSSQEFVEMLVVDGCFVIECLLKYAEGVNDPKLSGQLGNLPTLRRDLLLLENQIPFFILHTILQNSNYRNPKFPKETTKLLICLSLNYISNGKITMDMQSEDHQIEENIDHLLHLSYLCLLQGQAAQNPNTHASEETSSQYPLSKTCISSSTNFFKRWVRFMRHCVSLFVIYFLCCVLHVLVLLFLWRNRSWSISSEKNLNPTIPPTATELKEAGVTFKKKNGNCSLNVSFDEDGNFHMPLLLVEENTDSMFRNFLFFEQSCPPMGNNFAGYVVLIDSLIDTSSDVAILKRHGVLESRLGCDGDVANLFNQLRSGLYFDYDHHSLKKVFHDLNNYCNKEHNKWRAKLIHDYFSNPWACFSVIAAVILLLLTAAQTVYTVKSFYAR